MPARRGYIRTGPRRKRRRRARCHCHHAEAGAHSGTQSSINSLAATQHECVERTLCAWVCARATTGALRLSCAAQPESVSLTLRMRLIARGTLLARNTYCPQLPSPGGDNSPHIPPRCTASSPCPHRSFSPEEASRGTGSVRAEARSAPPVERVGRSRTARVRPVAAMACPVARALEEDIAASVAEVQHRVKSIRQERPACVRAAARSVTHARALRRRCHAAASLTAAAVMLVAADGWRMVSASGRAWRSRRSRASPSPPPV